MIDPWIKGATKLPDEFKDLSGKLGKVDLILVTHGHGDHLGDAMEISKTNDVPMWAPAGLNQTLPYARPHAAAKLVPRMSKGGRSSGALPAGEPADHHGPRRAFAEMILRKAGTTELPSDDGAGWIIMSSRTASRSTTWATPACSAT